jgi:long-chain acyl-CoA synthetase
MKMLSAPRLDQRPIVSQEDVAVLQYTGGTTGVPKAATLTHRNLVSNCLQCRSWLTDVKEGQERILSVVPFFHVFGMTVCMNLSVAIGAVNIMLLMKLFDVKIAVEAVSTNPPSSRRPGDVPAINQLRDGDNGSRSGMRLRSVSGRRGPAV